MLFTSKNVILMKECESLSSYLPFLENAIEDEKAGKGYSYSAQDRVILDEMFDQLTYYGRKLHYLAEVDNFNIVGAGPIMARYIQRFNSEAVRAYLIPQIVSDKVPDCDRLILNLYNHFRCSDQYFSPPGKGSPVHIYLRYDNAFRTLKPKRLKAQLLTLAQNPHDFHRLPFTMIMLASWKIPEMKERLLFYLDPNNVTPELIGTIENDSKLIPHDLSFSYYEYIRREVQFTAINGLKYYPEVEIIDILVPYVQNSDEDIRAAAQKAINAIQKKLQT